MPLSEVPQTMTKEKLESTQSELPPFLPDQDFVELLWENGQIVMQGQSNRPIKHSITNTLSSQTGRFQERDSKDVATPKQEQFGATDGTVNDLSHSVPSGHIGLNAQDADMPPWINYPIEDSIQDDYCSEFFSEFSGVDPNSLSTRNDTLPDDRSSGFGQSIRDSHNVEYGHASKSLARDLEASRVRTNKLFPPSQQWQSSVPSTKSRLEESCIAGSSSSHQVPCRNSKQLQQNNGLGLRNFSHFSRPVALVKSNLQSVDRLRSNEKASTAALNDSVSDLKNLSVIQGQSAPVPPQVELRSFAKPTTEVTSIEQSEAICQEDIHNISDMNSRSPDLINHQSSSPVAFARHEIEKGPETVVASSSVCSANSAGVELTDHMNTAKRKNREGEESGYQSEDLEDESVGLKKPATGRGMSAKKGRAAEVHNLSERRRRDRINEKMRALQELIPNCNKVDKASMLEEAIEYLKTLQLQLQIMSTGNRLCMPPMMLPAGMQHILPPPMTHFSPIGVNMGMGMGLGYGMRMLDMNGSPGCPMIPVRPIMHGPQFPYPYPSMPPAASLRGMFGIPGQGLNVPMPFGSLSGFPPRVNVVPEVRRATTTPLPVSDAAPSSNSKDQEQHNIINLEKNTNPVDSKN